MKKSEIIGLLTAENTNGNVFCGLNSMFYLKRWYCKENGNLISDGLEIVMKPINGVDYSMSTEIHSREYDTVIEESIAAMQKMCIQLSHKHEKNLRAMYRDKD